MMTLKQKQFAKKYIETGNGTKAALEVYNTKDENVAAAIASENLTKPKVIEEINKILDRKGLTLEKVSEGVETIFTRGIETKISGDNLLRAAEMMYKLHGVYPANKSSHFRVDLKQELEKMSYQDLVKRYQERAKELQEILQD